MNNGTDSDGWPLAKVRDSIDALDTQIFKLLIERFELSQLAKKAKLAEGSGQKAAQESGASLARLDREEEVVNRLQEQLAEHVAEHGETVLTKTGVAAIYREIISSTLASEQIQKIVCLGPAGTFSELAARKRFGSQAELVFEDTIEEVFATLNESACHFAVVPLHNSGHRIQATYEGLEKYTPTLTIVGEVSLPIKMCVLGKEGDDLKTIEKLYGHSQALLQSSEWIKLSGLKTIAAKSSSAAVIQAMQDERAAALGPSHLAQSEGVVVLKREVGNNKNRETRFVVLGNSPTPPTGDDRTLMTCRIEDRPGSLNELIEIFSTFGVNLRMLHSDAADSTRGALFFIEAVGHAADTEFKKALDLIKKKTSEMRIYGSFPRGHF